MDCTSLGPLVETLVFAELSKQASWSLEPPTITHYRDHGGGEVDLVLERWDRRIVAIDVKAGATVRADAFATMKKLASVLKEHFVPGIVLYDGATVVPSGKDLWAAPISLVWRSAARVA